MQSFCIVRHLQGIKANYIREREKYSRLVGYLTSLIGLSHQLHCCIIKSF